MKNRKVRTDEIQTNPICIGAGLVALDVVINGDPKIPLKLFAGGSCGNVLTILSFFGWDSIPLARLKINDASKKLLVDLKEWNVNTSFISQTFTGSTPIIIQRIKKDKNGNAIHTFQFKNPENGEWLPTYKPILSTEIDSIIGKTPIPSVFYFDRINRSSIELAKYYKRNGAVVFFEPSSYGEPKKFEECLNVADIIKFSKERIKNYDQKYSMQRVPLEIETLGNEGLRYRFDHDLNSKEWIKISSYKISFVVDAAGAGDWFTSGLIIKLAKHGSHGFLRCTNNSIEEALKYGQSLGALNCFFDGARGLMYALNITQISVLVKKLQMSKMPLTIINKKDDLKPLDGFSIGSLY